MSDEVSVIVSETIDVVSVLIEEGTIGAVIISGTGTPPSPIGLMDNTVYYQYV